LPKQKYIIRDFSGGMNTKRDPRDLAENESSLIVNMSIDAIGKIRTSGGMYPHIRSFNAAGNISEYIPDASVNLAHTTPGSGGGYGAFYFESDHNLGNLVITDTKHPGTGNDLTIGDSSNGEISFEKVDSKPDGSAYVPSYDPE
tara:strand:- start:78 stop:509 length:432 start_codon:yes stop_codon:yes gene_type:complete